MVDLQKWDLGTAALDEEKAEIPLFAMLMEAERELLLRIDVIQKSLARKIELMGPFLIEGGP